MIRIDALVPKLLFGNQGIGNSVSRTWDFHGFCETKQSFLNARSQTGVWDREPLVTSEGGVNLKATLRRMPPMPSMLAGNRNGDDAIRRLMPIREAELDGTSLRSPIFDEAMDMKRFFGVCTMAMALLVAMRSIASAWLPGPRRDVAIIVIETSPYLGWPGAPANVRFSTWSTRWNERAEHLPITWTYAGVWKRTPFFFGTDISQPSYYSPHGSDWNYPPVQPFQHYKQTYHSRPWLPPEPTPLFQQEAARLEEAYRLNISQAVTITSDNGK